MSDRKLPPDSIAAAQEQFDFTIDTAIAFAAQVIRRTGNFPNGEESVKAYKIAQLRLQEIKLLVA